jgi:superfamily II DNA/RNA helicase
LGAGPDREGRHLRDVPRHRRLLGREIEKAYPGQGVVVLRGGDHGAKLAAERKFKRADGPRVLVCTAAGREGINLQFARILFNFDLPWNPMDMEQRIGRIHRYGQKHTAQVYNLVLSDTIEGKIFLLLDEKLKEIAKTLGKVDEHGNVAEDLRSQVLGQLSERLTYDKLYREALGDPELRRTKEELEAALSNASEARKVVFELFQDLDGFSLDDYKPFANVRPGLERVLEFLRASLAGKSCRPRSSASSSKATTTPAPWPGGASRPADPPESTASRSSPWASAWTAAGHPAWSGSGPRCSAATPPPGP